MSCGYLDRELLLPREGQPPGQLISARGENSSFANGALCRSKHKPSALCKSLRKLCISSARAEVKPGGPIISA